MALSANFYTFTNHTLTLPYPYRFGKNWKESTETKKRRRTIAGELAFCLAEDETVSATKRANQSHASYSQSENPSQTFSQTVAMGLPEVQDVLCYSFGFLSIKELGTVSMVCRKWKELAVDSRRVFVLSPWKSRESENIQYYNSKALEVMQGNPQEAITIYNKLLEFYPSSITIFLQRSKAFQIAKQYEESLKDLAKAIELDSNNFEAYQQRVTLNKEIFSSAVAEKIVADLTKMIELNPNLVSNYADRGFAFLVLKKHEEAYKDVCMAIEKNPQVARPYVTRSIIIMLKDPNDYHGQLLALRDCSRAIELCPNSSFNYQHRAFILTKLLRLDEALSDYSKAIKLRPQNVYCYYKAASLLKKMNQYSEAIRHYKVILFDLLGKRFTEDRRNFEQTIHQRFHNDQDIASYLKVEVKHRIPKPSALSFPVK